ncbi:hypothetical protein DNU06_08870 [Putridiphycobacter roseus]|uniref:DUF5689 domain-containing protein n=1 Tax=Putridiphycobacter roseus TaxID=2219161 RepID=A0A2W1NE41_9FLAO|nr:DUF5689 domain-containing protein [Putridiphycobacter roseus]PZE17373.1 hypothetical protein DNU06_08870 [Putridiphycobacter roseus]
MKRIIIISMVILGIAACKKELDHPPYHTLNANRILTIQEVIDLYQGAELEIKDTLSVFATVTMDESDGNIYKSLYIQDATAAINLRLLSATDFLVGDSLRINLLGALIDNYNGVMQLSNVDPSTRVIKQVKGQGIPPKAMSIEDIDTNFVNQLVILTGVQFAKEELGATYADAPAQFAENRRLEDCFGNSILLRTSGFAEFAGMNIAKGNGQVIVIVDRFNDDLQLKIRSFNEVEMTGERCNGITLIPGANLSKDFNDNSITSGGWMSVQVDGEDTWETSTVGGALTPYAKISNFNGGNFLCENWLISPKVAFALISNPTLGFNNDVNYDGDQLQLLVSEDYDGIGDPNLFIWVNITASVNWDSNPNGWGFENTGDINLSLFAGKAVYFAFKYTGSNTDGSTWEIDDIIING